MNKNYGGNIKTVVNLKEILKDAEEKNSTK